MLDKSYVDGLQFNNIHIWGKHVTLFQTILAEISIYIIFQQN